MLKLDVLAAELNLWANETEQIYRATKESKYRGDAKHLRYLAATLNQSSLPSTGVTSFNTRVGDVVLSSLDVTTALGYNPVTQARTLTINGVTYDLSADRSWTISTATPTLAQVTTAGNTTTNAINISQLTVTALSDYYTSVKFNSFSDTNYNLISFYLMDHTTSTVVLGRNGASVAYPYKSGMRANYGFVGNNFSGFHIFAGSNISQTIHTNGNIGIGTTTDAGYKLDVNGTFRVQNNSLNTFIASAGTISGRVDSLTFNTTTNTYYGLVFTPHNLDGEIRFRSSNSGSIVGEGRVLNFSTSTTNTGYAGSTFTFTGGTTVVAGQGSGATWNIFNINPSISTPNGGAGTYNILYIGGTVNYTGGATGIARGIYVNPTITLVPDFIGLEIAKGKVVTSSSITAASALAQGVYFNNTLVAAANNDVLVGLDINPTFTNGAFTGVSNIGLRVSGQVLFNAYGAYNTVTPTLRIENVDTNNVAIQIKGNVANYKYYWIYDSQTTEGIYKSDQARIDFYGGTNVGFTFRNNYGRLFTIVGSTGNVLIGTTTDAGYKLDVNGTARVGNDFTIDNNRYLKAYRWTNADTSLPLQLESNSTYNVTGINFISYNNSLLNNTKSLFTFGLVSPITTQSSSSVDVANVINIIPEINFANGTHTVRGIYYNPTLTSLTGTTHRAIETTSGDVIFNGGFVGVGTTTPQSPAGYNGITINSASSGSYVWFQTGGTNRYSIGSEGGDIWHNIFAGANTYFRTGGNYWLTIAATTGNILIGTTTDAGYKLDVNGTARIQGNTEISRTGADTQLTVARGGGASFTIQGKANSTSQSEGVNLYWTNNTWLKFVLGSSVVANFSNVGNLLVGTSTDSGYKLDVNGVTRVSGTGTFNGQDAFVVRSSAHFIFRVNNDENIIIGRGGGQETYISAVNSGRLLILNGVGASQTSTGGIQIGTLANYTQGTGTQVFTIINPVFNPTGYSDANFSAFVIAPTINQSANPSTVGLSRGLYINPTLVSPKDFRAIETTVGKIIHQGLTNATHTNQVYYNTTTGELTYGALPTPATPTLDQVTTAGNVTTNAITVGGLTANNKVYLGSNTPHANDATNIVTVNGIMSLSNGYIRIDGQNRVQISTSGWTWDTAITPTAKGYQGYSIQDFTLRTGSTSYNLDLGLAGQTNLRIANTTGNVLINTTTDAGYKLDVNGSARIVNSLSVNNNVIVGSGVYTPTVVLSATNLYRTIQNDVGGLVIRTNSYGLQINDVGTGSLNNAFLTVSGSKTASSALAQGVYFNNTLVAAANNDVLVGLDINPTFTNGAFTGVDNWDLRTKGKVLVSSTSTPNVFPLVVRSTNYPGILLQNGSTGTNHSAAPYDGFAFWMNYDVSHAKGLITNYENNGISIYNGTNPAIGLTIFGSTNNVAINTTTDAGYKLDVNGTTRVQSSFTGAVLKIDGTGAATGFEINSQLDNDLRPSYIVFSRGGTQKYIVGHSYGRSGFFISNGNDTVTYLNINSAGNVLVGTTTDGNAKFVVAGSITAASAIARGVYFNNTLTQSASGDILNALEIAPSFSVGAGTLLNYSNWIRLTGNYNPSAYTTNNNAVGIDLSNGYYNTQNAVGIWLRPTLSNIQNAYGIIIDNAQGWAIYQSSASVSSYFRGTTYLGDVTQGSPNFGSNNATLNVANGTNGGIKVGTGGNSEHLIISHSQAGATFSSIRNTYNNASSTMLIDVAGQNNLRLWGTGNVVVGGTTDAGYKLDVNGTARIQGNTILLGTLNMGNGSFSYSANPNDQFTITGNQGLILNHGNGNSAGAGGNIILGSSTSPNFTVSLSNIVRNGVAISRPVTPISGSSNVEFNSLLIDNSINYTNATSSIARGLYIAPTLTSVSNFRAIETTSGNVIFNGGNVGIGTSSPTDKFHIVDNTNGNKFGRISAGGTDASAAWVAQNDQVDNVVYRVFGSAVTGSQMGQALARSASLIANLGGTGKFLIGSYSGTDLIFGTSDQARMRLVDATGNFLIGTMTDTGNKLTVSGSIDAQGYKVNNVLGYTGIFNVPTNPPGQQNLDIQGGIVVNVF